MEGFVHMINIEKYSELVTNNKIYMNFHYDMYISTLVYRELYKFNLEKGAK